MEFRELLAIQYSCILVNKENTSQILKKERKRNVLAYETKLKDKMQETQ